MKIYRGPLDKALQEKIKANINTINEAISLQGLGRVSNGNTTTTIDETIKKYNTGITKKEIQAWVWHRKNQGLKMASWKTYFVNMTESLKLKFVQDKLLFFDPITKSLVPFPVFVFGNLYDKKSKLSKYKETIIADFGQTAYENHIETLEKHIPDRLSIQNPIESERPIFLAISDTAQDFKINSLRSDAGVVLEKETNLQGAYRKWLFALPSIEINKTTAYEIINYYVNKENKPRNIDPIEWSTIQKQTKNEGERLFKLFLHVALERADQIKLDEEYNRKYNATAPLQYTKIPIGIEVSRKFKSFDLEIKPAQREGIAFMELVGSGIIAYDVGVGKTITAIIELASAILNGKCKRPLVVVPNPTYKNWILEMIGDGTLQGVLSGTGITINEWFNLGAGYDHLDLEKKVDEKSITLVTYEGLNKIGFDENTQNEHFNELSNILGQRGKTERQEAQENEKFREIIGVGLKETTADIETLGFDYVVVDEAHNYKNVFTSVKSDEDNKSRFEIRGGKASNRAIKLFFVCNYIQRKYGRNVMLLSATPFTNSPLEIYSMLSFVAYEYMSKNNILNIRQFFEQYIQETYEDVVSIDGEISQRSVVKSFNNRISLQKLITSHINFKTGEEANIPRPCKVNLPKTTKTTESGTKKLAKDDQVLTYLKLNDEQSIRQKELNAEASEGADKDDPGKLLRLMSYSLNNALSPYINPGNVYNSVYKGALKNEFKGKRPSKAELQEFKEKFNNDYIERYGDAHKPKDYNDFVNASPKILYTMECIKSVKEYHEKRNEDVSGQVIYIDRGKDYFRYIKEYLEKELGYKKKQPLLSNKKIKVDEVEVISSGITAAKKEAIKEAFNEGVCKVIIGTSTIKEGINLQTKATVLYNLYPNWNPTDLRQLEGRIWRQKNQFKFVRIVMPLMENSMDVFVFQKLEEKTARINDLWSKNNRGNVLDEESLDPNEVKFALVTDIEVLLRFERKKLAEELTNNKIILTAQIDDLANYTSIKTKYEYNRSETIRKIREASDAMASWEVFRDKENRAIYFRDVAELDLETLTKENQAKIERYNKAYALLNEVIQGDLDDKTLIKAFGSQKRIKDSLSYYSYDDSSFEQFKDNVSQLGKIKRTLFTNRGYNENTDISSIKTDFEKELELIELEIEESTTEAFIDTMRENIIKEKKRLAIKGGDLKSRVEDFKSLNNLLSFPFDKKTSTYCSLPTTHHTSKTPIADNKTKRLKIAKAKAIAIKLKLKLSLAA